MKVRPETDDEMARRIKCMLGEYVREDDFDTDDKEEPVIIPVENGIESSSSNENSKLPQNNLEDMGVKEDAEEKDEDLLKNSEIVEAEDKNSDVIVSLGNNEGTKDADNSQNSATETSGNSRRCSLKRQCKDKISLLDYNPMLTIRTLKRPRLSSSSKGKTFENSDVSIPYFYSITVCKECLLLAPSD